MSFDHRHHRRRCRHYSSILQRVIKTLKTIVVAVDDDDNSTEKKETKQFIRVKNIHLQFAKRHPIELAHARINKLNTKIQNVLQI